MFLLEALSGNLFLPEAAAFFGPQPSSRDDLTLTSASSITIPSLVLILLFVRTLAITLGPSG